MSSFESKETDTNARLKLAARTLFCFAVTGLPLVILKGVANHLEKEDAGGLLVRLFFILPLTVTCLRMFQLISLRHLALSLIPSALSFGVIHVMGRNDLGVDAVMPIATIVAALFVMGGPGIAVGGHLAPRAKSSMRHRILYLTVIAALYGLIIGPWLYRYAVAGITSARAGIAGIAQLNANITDLKRTVIVPTLDTPLSAGTNMIWCGTMQLAWNELCALVGEDVHMENEDPIVGQLSKRDVSAKNLDENTYLLAALPADSSSLSALRKRVSTKFSGAVSPELIPAADTLPRNSIMLYAALFVNMPFDWAFDRLKHPLKFGGGDVAAFGIDGDGDLGDRRRVRSVRSQVKVIDFNGNDDFVIELKTKKSNHQLILSKLRPELTLESTVRSVLTRMTVTQPESSFWFNRLIVPVADYDLAHCYPELVGRPLCVKTPLFDKMPIVAANQNIRFKLDERGAVLKSEALIGVKTASKSPKGPPDLIFDKPFLVLLKCTTSDKPYFAMWVDNPEILVKFGKDAK